MSELLDERVVEMRFDNADFEQNVNQSIKTINKLKESLDFEDAGDSFEQISAAAASCDLSPMEKSIDEISVKFNMLDMVAANVVSNIANKVADAGLKMAKSLTLDQVTSGWSKYEQKTQSVQTIMAATGRSIEDVNSELERLIWFADETSYSFVDMVNNIGKFTSAGVPLEKAVNSMIGISDWAALSGAGIQQASRAMYNLSQAMGMGHVAIQDWKSIELANMATVEFKDTVIETALRLGTLKQEADGTIKTLDGKAVVTALNMRESLKKGWFTGDVLTDVLEQYSEFANEVYRIQEQMGYDTANQAIDFMKDAGYDLSDKFAQSFLKAQEAITFTQAIDAIKDAVSSQWMQTFELIFGNYEQSKKLWTQLSNDLWDIFASPGERFNSFLGDVLNSNYQKMLGELPDAVEFNNQLTEKLYNITKKNKGEAAANELVSSYDSIEDLMKNAFLYDSTIKEAFDDILADYSKELTQLKTLSENFKKKNITLQQAAIRMALKEYGSDEETIRKNLEPLGFQYEDLVELSQRYINGETINWEYEQKEFEKLLQERIQIVSDFQSQIKGMTPLEGFFSSITEFGGRDKLISGFEDIMYFIKSIWIFFNDLGDGIAFLFGADSILSAFIDGFYKLRNVFKYAGNAFKSLSGAVTEFFHGGIQEQWDRFLHGYEKVFRDNKELVSGDHPFLDSEMEHVPGLLERIDSLYREHLQNLPVEVQNTIEKIKTDVFGFISSVPEGIKNIKEAILGVEKTVGYFNDKGELIKTETLFEGGLINDFTDNFKSFADRVMPGALDGITDFLGKIADILFGYEKDGEEFKGVITWIYDKVLDFIDLLKTIGKSAKDIFGTVFEDVKTFFTGGKYSFSDAVIWSFPARIKKHIEDLTSSTAFQEVKKFIFGGEDKKKDPSIFGRIQDFVNSIATSPAFIAISKFIFGGEDKKKDPSIFGRIQNAIDSISKSAAFTAISKFIFGGEDKEKDPNIFKRIQDLINSIATSPAFTAISKFIFGGEDKKKDPNIFGRIQNVIDSISKSPAFTAISKFIFGGEDKEKDPSIFGRIQDLINSITASPAFLAISKFIFGGENKKKDPSIFGRIQDFVNSIATSPAFLAISKFIFGGEDKEKDPNIFKRIQDFVNSIATSPAFLAISKFIFGGEDKKKDPSIFGRIQDFVNSIATSPAFLAISKFIFGGEDKKKDPSIFGRIQDFVNSIATSPAFTAISKFIFGGENKRKDPNIFGRIEKSIKSIHESKAFKDVNRFLFGETKLIQKTDTKNGIDYIYYEYSDKTPGLFDTLKENFKSLWESTSVQSIISFISGDYFENGPASLKTFLFGDKEKKELSFLEYQLNRIKETDWFSGISDFLFGKKDNKVQNTALNSFFRYFHTAEEYEKANIFGKLKLSLQDLQVYLFGWKEPGGAHSIDGILTPIINKVKELKDKLEKFFASKSFKEVKNFFLGEKDAEGNVIKKNIFGKIADVISTFPDSFKKAKNSVLDFFLGPVNEEGKRTENILKRLPGYIKTAANSVKEFFFGDKEKGIDNLFIRFKNGFNNLITNSGYANLHDFIFGNESREQDNIVVRFLDSISNKLDELKIKFPWLQNICDFLIQKIEKIRGFAKNVGFSIHDFIYGHDRFNNETFKVERVPGIIEKIQDFITSIKENGLFKKDDKKNKKSFLERISDFLVGTGKTISTITKIPRIIKNIMGPLAAISVLLLGFSAIGFGGFQIKSPLENLVDMIQDIVKSVAIIVGLLVGLSLYLRFLDGEGVICLIGAAVTIGLIMAALFFMAKKINGDDKKSGAIEGFKDAAAMFFMINFIKTVALLTTVLAGAIIALSLVIKLLGPNGPDIVFTASMSIALVIAAVGFAIKMMNDSFEKSKDATGKLHTHAGELWGIAAILAAISSLISTIVLSFTAIYLVTKGKNWDEIRMPVYLMAATLMAVTGMLLIISAQVKKLAVIKPISGKTLVALFSLTACVVVLGSLAAAMAIFGDWKEIAASLGGLSLLLWSLAGVMKVLSTIPEGIKWKNVGVMLVIVGALGALAIGFLWLSNAIGTEVDFKKVFSIMVSIIELAVAFGAVAFVIGAIAKFSKGLENFDVGATLLFLGKVMLIVVAIVAVIILVAGLVAKIKNVKEYIEGAGEILEAISNALGRMIGGFIGGIGEGIINSLPNIAESLSTFMTNLGPFLDGIKNLKDEHSRGMGILFKLMLGITGIGLLEALNKLVEWVSGGNSISSAFETLNAAADGLATFSGKVKDLEYDDIKHAAKIIPALLDIASNPDYKTGGISGALDWFINGSINLGKLFKKLNQDGAADGLREFESKVKGLSYEDVEAAADVIPALLNIATDERYKSGGINSHIDEFTNGKIDLGALFAKLNSGAADGLVTFAGKVSGLDYESAKAAADVIPALLNIASDYRYRTGGKKEAILSYISGNIDLGELFNRLNQNGAADGLVTFAGKVSGLDYESAKAAADVIPALLNIASDPNYKTGGEWTAIEEFLTGTVNLGELFSRLNNGAAEGLVTFAGKISGLDYESAKAAADVIPALLNIATNPDYKKGGVEGAIEDFITGTTNFEKLFDKLNDEVAPGFVEFTTAIQNVTLDKAERAAAILPKIFDMLSDDHYRSGGVGGWIEKLIKGESTFQGMFDVLLGVNGKEGILDGLEKISSKLTSPKFQDIDFSVVNKAVDAAKNVFELMSFNTSDLITDTDQEQEGWTGYTFFNEAEKLYNALGVLRNKVVPEISQLQKDLEAAGVKADYISSIIGSYSQLIKSMVDLSKFDGMIGSPEIGNFIIEGLVNALRDGETRVEDAARGVASAVKNGLTLSLEIHSPSKVAYEIGQFVAQGLYNGIAAGEEMNYKLARLLGRGTIEALEEGAIGYYGALSKHAINMVTEDLVDENRFNMPDFSFINHLGMEDIDFEKMRSFLYEKFGEVFDPVMIDGFVNAYKHEWSKLPKEILDESYAQLIKEIAKGDYGLGQDEIVANLADRFAEEADAVGLAQQAWEDYNDVLAGNIKLNEDILKKKKENPPMTYEQYMDMVKHEQEGVDLANKGFFDKLAAANGTSREEEMRKLGYDPRLTQQHLDYMYMSGEEFEQLMFRMQAEEDLRKVEDKRLREQTELQYGLADSIETVSEKTKDSAKSADKAADSYIHLAGYTEDIRDPKAVVVYDDRGREISQTKKANEDLVKSSKETAEEIQSNSEIISESARNADDIEFENFNNLLTQINNGEKKYSEVSEELLRYYTKFIYSKSDSTKGYSFETEKLQSLYEQITNSLNENEYSDTDRKLLEATNNLLFGFKYSENAPKELAEASNEAAEEVKSNSETIAESTEEAVQQAVESTKYIDKINFKNLDELLTRINDGETKYSEAEKEQLRYFNQANMTDGAFGNGIEVRKQNLLDLGVAQDNLNTAIEIMQNSNIEEYLAGLEEVPKVQEKAADSTEKTADVFTEYLNSFTDLSEGGNKVLSFFTDAIKDASEKGADQIKLDLNELAKATGSSLTDLFEQTGDTGKKLQKQANKNGILTISIEKLGLHDENGKPLNAKEITERFSVSSLMNGLLGEFGFTSDATGSYDITDLFNQLGNSGESFEENISKIFSGLSNIVENGTGIDFLKILDSANEKITEINENPLEPKSDVSQVAAADAYIQDLYSKWKFAADDEKLKFDLAVSGYEQLTKGETITENQAEALEQLYHAVTIGAYGSVEEFTKLLTSKGIDWANLITYVGGRGGKMFDGYVSSAKEYAASIKQAKKDYKTIDLIHDIEAGKWGEGLERKEAFDYFGIDWDKIHELFARWKKEGDKVFEDSNIGDFYGFITDEEKKAAEEQKRLNDVLTLTPEGAFKTVNDFLESVSRAVKNPEDADAFNGIMTKITDALKEVKLENAPAFEQVATFFNAIRNVAHESTGIATDFEKFTGDIQNILDNFDVNTEKFASLSDASSEFSDFVTDIKTSLDSFEVDMAKIDPVTNFFKGIGAIASSGISTAFSAEMTAIQDSLNSLEIDRSKLALIALLSGKLTGNSQKDISKQNKKTEESYNAVNKLASNPMDSGGGSRKPVVKSDSGQIENLKDTETTVSSFFSTIQDSLDQFNIDETKFMPLTGFINDIRSLPETGAIDIFKSFLDGMSTAIDAFEINPEKLAPLTQLCTSIVDISTVDVTATAVGAATALVTAITDILESKYDQFTIIGVMFISNLIDGMNIMATPATNAAASIAASILGALRAHGSDQSSLVGADFINGLSEGIRNGKDTIDEALDYLFGTGDKEATDLSAQTEGLSDVTKKTPGASFADAFISDVKEALTSTTGVSTIVGSFTQTITGAFDNIDLAGEGLVNSFKTIAKGLDAGFGSVSASINATASKIRSAISSAVPNGFSLGYNFCVQLAAGLIAGAPIVQAAAASIKINIGGGGGGTGGAGGTGGTGGAVSTGSPSGGGAPSGGGPVSTGGGDAYGVHNAAYNVGANISGGIAAGMRDGGKLVKDAGEKVAEDAINATKNPLEIASPSKVFRKEVGQQIPAGIAQGIDDSIPLVMKAADQLASVLVDSSTSAVSKFSSSLSGAVTNEMTRFAGNMGASVKKTASQTNSMIHLARISNKKMPYQPPSARGYAGKNIDYDKLLALETSWAFKHTMKEFNESFSISVGMMGIEAQKLQDLWNGIMRGDYGVVDNGERNRKIKAAGFDLTWEDLYAWTQGNDNLNVAMLSNGIRSFADAALSLKESGSLHDMLNYIYSGNLGSGDYRRKIVESLGFNYDAVQMLVKEVMNNENFLKKSDEELTQYYKQNIDILEELNKGVDVVQSEYKDQNILDNTKPADKQDVITPVFDYDAMENRYYNKMNGLLNELSTHLANKASQQVAHNAEVNNNNSVNTTTNSTNITVNQTNKTLGMRPVDIYKNTKSVIAKTIAKDDPSNIWINRVVANNP